MKCRQIIWNQRKFNLQKVFQAIHHGYHTHKGLLVFHIIPQSNQIFIVNTSENSDPLEALETLTDTVLEDTKMESEEEQIIWCTNPNPGKDNNIDLAKDMAHGDTAIEKNAQFHSSISSHIPCFPPSSAT